MRKAPDIDFVRSRMPSMTWALAGMLIFSIGLAVALYLQYRAERRVFQVAIQDAQQRWSASSRSAMPSSSMSAEPLWLKEAKTSVAEDWNALFDRVEGLEIPGVRLVSMQAGLYPHSIRAEFELDGWTRVSELNSALNLSRGAMRWHLVSVANTAGVGAMSGGVRAVWER